MDRKTIPYIVLLLDVTLILAQSADLSMFAQSVEGTKIKTKPGRHVCTTERTISRPIPVIQKYRKPVYTPKPRECPNVSSCPQYDVSYVLANRTVYQLQKSSKFEINCCPGWTKEKKREKGCMQPICKNGCGDFGICVKPDTCACRSGYTGPLCDTDIDECRTNEHGCQHQCKNTAGSYMCACQEGFNLAPDGHTCLFCFTCQKEYVDMLNTISALKSQQPAIVPNTDGFEELNRTVHQLRHEIQMLTDENTQLKEKLKALDNKYETAMVDISLLQNLTRTEMPCPTSSTSTTTTTTKKTTTTQQTTTQSPTTTSSTTTASTATPFTEEMTESGIDFDPLHLI